MIYSEWQRWVQRNRPQGMPDNEFRDFLALIGTLTVQQNINEQGITMDELIHKFFTGKDH